MILEIRGIRKQFEKKEHAILQEINLSLGEGEVIGLVGSSGSGKTTLLRLLAGLEEPSAGTILFRGKTVSGPSQQLIAGHPSIRLVHQHFELAHRLSVYENVAQKLRHLHPDEQKERTLELLEVCHLTALANAAVEQLSGGEKQRLALARTLAEDPELLLLDEPFSNLDPPLKEAIKERLFRYIRQQGIAAILVSHDAKDALSVADQLWVLQQGRVIQEGAPEEVYFRSASPEVASLFGKINLCRKEALEEVLIGEALHFLQKLPPGCLVGIRPEVLQLSPAEEAQLEAIVLEKWFSGSSRELVVETGKQLQLILRLSSIYAVREQERVHLKLQMQFLQYWEE